MSSDNPTRQEIYEAKAADRLLSAKEPMPVKMAAIVRMQWMQYELKTAAGKRPARPWTMPLDEYEAEWGREDELAGRQTEMPYFNPLGD